MSGSNSESPRKHFAALQVEHEKTPKSSDKKVKENSSPLTLNNGTILLNANESTFCNQK